MRVVRSALAFSMKWVCLYYVLFCCCCFESEGVPPNKQRDAEVQGFFVAPSTPTKKEQVSMVTSSGATATCVFEYKQTDKNALSKPPAEVGGVPVSPAQVLMEDTKPGSPCLSAVAGFHSYAVCLGTEIVQHVGKSEAEKILIGNAPTWHSNYFEQYYVNGTECPNTNVKRKATVFFLCGPSQTLQISNVLEPQPCAYEIEILTAKACGYPKQVRRTLSVAGNTGNTETIETWFMEISEVAGTGITCTTQAAGFGQPIPSQSELIKQFSVRLTTNNAPLPIKNFEVRHGTGVAYPSTTFELSSDGATLSPQQSLPESTNLVIVTALSP